MTQKEYEIICRFIDLRLRKIRSAEELKKDIRLLVEKEGIIPTQPTIITQPNYSCSNYFSKDATQITPELDLYRVTCATSKERENK